MSGPIDLVVWATIADYCCGISALGCYIVQRRYVKTLVFSILVAFVWSRLGNTILSIISELISYSYSFKQLPGNGTVSSRPAHIILVVIPRIA